METINDIPKVIQDEQPKVIQNSDYLYKKDVVWDTNIEYKEPTEYEKEMLKDSKTAEQLLKEEQEEVIVVKTEEELKQEKIKNLVLMFKVITCDRMNLHPLYNLSNLQPSQAERFKNNMESLGEDYNNGMIKEITNEFNRICNEKLFQCGADVSCYPVYS
jgi:cysteinyl-tRNA synthetase